jgi:hypothetical protein
LVKADLDAARRESARLTAESAEWRNRALEAETVRGAMPALRAERDALRQRVTELTTTRDRAEESLRMCEEAINGPNTRQMWDVATTLPVHVTRLRQRVTDLETVLLNPSGCCDDVKTWLLQRAEAAEAALREAAKGVEDYAFERISIRKLAEMVGAYVLNSPASTGEARLEADNAALRDELVRVLTFCNASKGEEVVALITALRQRVTDWHERQGLSGVAPAGDGTGGRDER